MPRGAVNFGAAVSLISPEMSRQFPIPVGERQLKLCVMPADESWELWLCERGHRLLLAGRVAMDEAIQSWRRGDDAVAALRERVTDQVLKGETCVPATGNLDCTARCDWRQHAGKG